MAKEETEKAGKKSRKIYTRKQMKNKQKYGKIKIVVHSFTAICIK